jgi:hypothetical protein
MDAVIKEASNYLASHEFEPHRYRDYGLYGLNLIGTDSTVFYQEKLWRFICFEGELALYVNVAGEIMRLTQSYQYGVSRMQVKSPVSLPTEVYDYLLALYDFIHQGASALGGPTPSDAVQAFFEKYELSQDLLLLLYEEKDGVRHFNLDILRNYTLRCEAPDVVFAKPVESELAFDVKI